MLREDNFDLEIQKVISIKEQRKQNYLFLELQTNKNGVTYYVRNISQTNHKKFNVEFLKRGYLG